MSKDNEALSSDCRKFNKIHALLLIIYYFKSLKTETGHPRDEIWMAAAGAHTSHPEIGSRGTLIFPRFSHPLF